MARGDAELASVMRKLLANEDHLLLDMSWDHHERQFVLTLSGSECITEDEALAIEEAQNA